MTLRIDRRSLLMTGTLGLGALAVPGFAQSALILAATGFTSGVASGEPGPDTMLLWTRYVPADGGPARVRVEVAETADFKRVVAGGEMVTGPWRDHTAKITVDGLRPGTRYHYRFVAPDGSFSGVGRTKTLADGDARRFSAAIFSCSNIGFGYFNAYAHAAAQDFDVSIHLGDYFYEYSPGAYPPATAAVPGRVPEPMKELVALADYRLRYASYRADPDLAALHAAMPMIASRDDHESANDSWEGGAENHQPATEGDWTLRKIAALQAYREWMPVGDEPWKAYDLGGLGTYYRTDTRQLARSRQPDLTPFFKAADPVAALKGFHDGAWQDPAATMMGTEQESWLAHAMRDATRRRPGWQVVGVGAVMGQSVTPANAGEWLGPDASERAKAYVRRGIASAQVGLPGNLDSWGGYPQARARLLKAAQAADAPLIVLSGDSHNAWAFDLAQGGRPAGVEFAGHSVTSPGYESSVAADPKVVAKGLVDANPELKWCDTSRRGYMAMTLTPGQARNDWVFMDTVKARSAAATVGHTATVRRGTNRMG